MSRALSRILTALLALMFLAFLGFQVFRFFYNPISTMTVEDYNIYDTIDTEGIAIRKEQLLIGMANGYLSFAVGNGEKVSKEEVVAHVFPTESDSRAGHQIDYLEKEIKLLRDIESQGTANRDKLSLIDRQINQTLSQMKADTGGSGISNMSTWQSSLLELLNKRQITTGKVNNFTDRIATLTGLKNSLSSSSAKHTDVVKAPVAGYFVSTADGYESAVEYDNILTMDSITVAGLIKNQADERYSIPTGSKIVGKVVEDYQWRFACVMPSESAGLLREGEKYDLYLPFVSRDAIPFIVASVNRGVKDAAVVFQSEYMSGTLASIRCESVQIRLRKYEGLRVPSRSVQTDSDGNNSVYILVGDTVEYRNIKIIHSEPDFVICERNVIDTEGNLPGKYLKIYDEIIVEGKDLFHGKTIR